MNVVTGRPGTTIGPLTTVFSFPESCTVNLVMQPDSSELFQGQKCVTELDGNQSPLRDNHECWPPMDPDFNLPVPAPPFSGWGFYSPGLECPTGYTSACTAIEGLRPDWDIEFVLDPGETAIGCCPSGFKCTNRFGNSCIAVAAKTMVVPTGVCDGSKMSGSIMVTITPDILTITDSGSESTADRTFTFYAPMFQLNYKSTDLASVVTSRTSHPSPSIPSSTSTSSPEDDENTSHALSPGAKAGIGIGAAFGALIILAIVGRFCWLRGRRAQHASTYQVQGGGSGIAIASTSPRTEMGIDGKSELGERFGSSSRPSTTRIELDAGQRPSELP